jgi:hypothetical protein
METKAETEKTHTGGCHCGKVRFEVRGDLSKATACNCSMCSKTGTLLAFLPADRLTLLSGGDTLSDYQFGQKRIHHLFCPSCGIRSFARGTAPDGQEMVAVNVRCVDDVDLDALTIRHFDGKHL